MTIHSGDVARILDRLADREVATKAGRIHELHGLGPKMEQRLLDALAHHVAEGPGLRLASVKAVAQVLKMGRPGPTSGTEIAMKTQDGIRRQDPRRVTPAPSIGPPEPRRRPTSSRAPIRFGG